MRRSWLMVPFLLVAAWLATLTAYLLALTAAALGGRPAVPGDGPARRRFAVLIPAHNEEALIGRLLDNLRQVDYPVTLVSVHVVADNCDDETAARARAAGARVHERFDRSQQAKGFALRWLLEQLHASGDDYDAFVVLDADSIVQANFLRAMDARLEAGSQVVQAYYTVLNADESPVATLRFVALAAVHYLRPLGHAALGLSCGLKGNGMCFVASVLERFSWEWYTLAEDVEFHLELVRAGIRVDFAPETTVLADMPVTLEQATSQNERWERGRLQLLRRHVPGLLLAGLARRDAVALDAAAEQFVPPLSVPFALGALCLGIGLLGPSKPLVGLSAASLLGQAVYLLSGLALVRAPWCVYRSLGYAPLYVTWKLGVYARALLSTQSARWIRTARKGGGGRC